jgi:hypothetical protein
MVLGKTTELWRQTDDNFKKKIHVLLRFGAILRLFRLDWSFFMGKDPDPIPDLNPDLS